MHLCKKKKKKKIAAPCDLRPQWEKLPICCCHGRADGGRPPTLKRVSSTVGGLDQPWVRQLLHCQGLPSCCSTPSGFRKGIFWSGWATVCYARRRRDVCRQRRQKTRRRGSTWGWLLRIIGSYPGFFCNLHARTMEENWMHKLLCFLKLTLHRILCLSCLFRCSVSWFKGCACKYQMEGKA